MSQSKEPPYFLEASSKLELRKLMLANNRKYGKKFHYFDFSFAQGKWHCLFELREIERVKVEGDGQSV